MEDIRACLEKKGGSVSQSFRRFQKVPEKDGEIVKHLENIKKKVLIVET